MDCIQSGQELRCDISCVPQLQRSFLFDHFHQRDSIDVFHGDQFVISFADQIENAADIGRNHFASDAHFAPDHVKRVLITLQIPPQCLERHIHSKLYIVRMPHFAHSAFTKAGQNRVTARNKFARSQ